MKSFTPFWKPSEKMSTFTDKMKTLLLDTNIVIYSINKVRYFEPYREHLENATLAISIVTSAELYEGAYRAGENTRTYRTITEALTQYLILPLDERICRQFGKIRAQRRNRPISVPDALIAATALAYELPLVTHNKPDFDDIPGLNLKSEYGKV